MSTPQPIGADGRGRGPFRKPPRAEEASQPRTVRFSPLEISRVRQAAEVNRQRPSDFIRDAVLNAAEESLEPPERQ